MFEPETASMVSLRSGPGSLAAEAVAELELTWGKPQKVLPKRSECRGLASLGGGGDGDGDDGCQKRVSEVS